MEGPIPGQIIELLQVRDSFWGRGVIEMVLDCKKQRPEEVDFPEYAGCSGRRKRGSTPSFTFYSRLTLDVKIQNECII